MNLRRWLRKDPKPAKLRVDGRDLVLPTVGNVWAALEETITAMNPTKVEALNADGAVLRVLGFDDDGEPAALAADATEKASASALVEMSRLLMQAHDAGAQRHAQAYEIAYANQTALLGVIASRLVGLETAWGKAMNALAVANADLAQVSAAEDGDPAGQAIGMLLARAFGTPPAPAGAPAAPPAKNGKKEAS